jgi:hypothetical protein
MLVRSRLMTIAALCAAIGVFATDVAIAAGSSPKSSMLPESLTQARFYAWGMVGTPGAVSVEESSARELAKGWSPDRIARVMADANPEGQLYLLCILRRNDPSAYAVAKAKAGFKADQQVSVFAGNVLRKVPVSEVTNQIEANACEPLSWRL